MYQRLQPVQSVHNSVGNVLSELHWLPVQSRMYFKTACLTYRILSTGQPSYLRAFPHHYTARLFYAQLTNISLSNIGVPLNPYIGSWTHHFLLTFHSNYVFLVPIPRYTAISVENRTFSHPRVFAPRWRGSSWNCVSVEVVEKLEW